MAGRSLLDASGRVLLLTGAAGGIGAAVAAAYRQAGGTVAGLDLVGDELVGGEDILACDTADEAAVAAAVAAVLERHGRIDDVVHAAGVVGEGRLADMALAAWQRVLDANLTSAFLLARACAGPLAAARGRLVFLSSTNGRNGGSHLSGAAYAVAKAGLINLTRYLAREWAGDGVRVNCVAPGPVDTPMLARLDAETRAALEGGTLTGRLPTADDIAASIAFLLSDNAAAFTGTTLNPSAGFLLD